MYEIQYHPKVADDLAHISTSHKNDIRRYIEEKLRTKPEFFGKPLQFSLKGARSMRVGDYRVIFQISKHTVRILLTAHRSVVYKNVGARM